MPKVNIAQPHACTAEDAKKRLETLSTNLSEKYGLAVSWQSDTQAKVERTGAKGNIRIEPKQVCVDLDLSFVLSPMKDTIESKIREELRKLFATESKA